MATSMCGNISVTQNGPANVPNNPLGHAWGYHFSEHHCTEEQSRSFLRSNKKSALVQIGELAGCRSLTGLIEGLGPIS